MLLRRAHLAMVQANRFRECSRLPSLHPGGKHGNVVDPASLNGLIPADLFKAFAAEYLARSGDVLYIHKAIIVNLVRSFLEWRADQAELRVRRELLQQEREIVGVERHIRIKACHYMKVQLLYAPISRVEGLHFPRKMPFLAFGHADQLHPRVV